MSTPVKKVPIHLQVSNQFFKVKTGVLHKVMSYIKIFIKFIMLVVAIP